MREDLWTQAIEYLKKVEQSEWLWGTNLELKAASCLLISTQNSKIPWNVKDLIWETGKWSKDLFRVYKSVKEICELKFSLKPENIVNIITGKLSLPPKVVTLAIDIAKWVNDGLYLEGWNPHTIAGAAVLITIKHLKDPTISVTTDDIANAA